MSWLASQRWPCLLMKRDLPFEIGYKQGMDLKKLLSLHFPDKRVRVLKDQFGQDRMVVIDDEK